MVIYGITLQTFRSFRAQTFVFDPQISYVIGRNTAGKTNILEAIAFISSGKSFRGVVDKDMISWNNPLARVKAKLREDQLEIILTQGNVNGVKTPYKKYLVNGVARRAVDAVGVLKSVVFSPEDVDLVTGSPSSRRNFLDFILCQADKEYRRSLASYEKGLRQRNKLLYLIHEGLATRDQLEFWNKLIIEHGQYLTKIRERFLLFSRTIAVPSKEFLPVYDQSTISVERLATYAQEEVAAKVTLVGPHRDDFSIRIKKQEDIYVDVSVFGSRGEQRLSVLWIKLAALEYLLETTGQRPILLLDDIFSELDSNHQEIVMNVVNKYQTIITSTDRRAVEELRRVQPGLLIEL